jgi:hypothetical protein
MANHQIYVYLERVMDTLNNIKTSTKLLGSFAIICILLLLIGMVVFIFMLSFFDVVVWL